MLELLAQIVTSAAILTWVWFLPNAMAGKPLMSPPPWLRRWVRRAVARVKYVLTWPGRSQAERTAGQIALRMQLREEDPRFRELMMAAPPMRFERRPDGDEILVRRDGRGVQVVRTATLPEGFVPPSGALFFVPPSGALFSQGFEPGIRPPEPQPSIFTSHDALVQLASGRPPTDAGPSSWTPTRIAAMPTTRCNACPEWGCAAQGDNPECASAAHPYRPSCSCERCSDVVSYEEVRTHERIQPVAYVPTGRSSDRGRPVFDRWARDPEHIAEAQRMFEDAMRDRAGRDRLAAVLGIARLPQPLDDEIAKPPRDEFDAQKPTYPCGRFDRHPPHDCGEHFEEHCPGGLPRVRPPEERLSASLPCPFCGGHPILGEDGAWREVHGKRCVLRKRDRRRRPSGAQRRKLRDRIKDALAEAAREQLDKDLAQARETLRWEQDKGRKCGACDRHVLEFFDGAFIDHAVGCPRRSWPVDRAALPPALPRRLTLACRRVD